jgi:ParB family chromosome partitioning protein
MPRIEIIRMCEFVVHFSDTIRSIRIIFVDSDYIFMRQSFGKGIESLIPKKKQKSVEKPVSRKEAVFFIEIEKIKSNPYQPRKEFNMEALNSLAESIREYGILQPLIVTKIEKANSKGKSIRTEYQLIAGERRLMASKIAGLKEVPVIIRKPTDKERLEMSLIENVQRFDLNPIEKAEAFNRLHKEFGMTHEKIGELVGLGRVAVTNHIRLLDLAGDIKEAVRTRKINEGQARAILLTKGGKKQKAVFEKILKDGLNVRESEYFAQKLNIWKPVKNNLRTDISDEIINFEMQFKEIFGVTAKTVRLVLEKGRPKLTVFFDSPGGIKKVLEKFK